MIAQGLTDNEGMWEVSRMIELWAGEGMEGVGGARRRRDAKKKMKGKCRVEVVVASFVGQQL